MCGVSVAICENAMKKLVFYMSFPSSNSWVAAGVIWTYSVIGPGPHSGDLSKVKLLQPIYKAKNKLNLDI